MYKDYDEYTQERQQQAAVYRNMTDEELVRYAYTRPWLDALPKELAERLESRLP